MKLSKARRKPSIPFILVSIAVTAYIVIFSFMSVRRIHMLWASYFDLGIMHQTVYNTYKGIQTLDFSRILELTDPHESGRQINRIAIHNDMLLAALAPFYFIHAGPETLLIIQTVVLASGAFALYFIIKRKSRKWPSDKQSITSLISVVIPAAYLLYFPMQKTNLYEFHAVVLSTALILWMYLAYVHRKWVVCGILFVLILLSKEHVGFSLGTFLMIEVGWARARHLWRSLPRRGVMYSYICNVKTQALFLVALGSFVYVLLNVFVIIPSYRLGNDHFALNYFTGNSSNVVDFVRTQLSHVFNVNIPSYIFTIASPLLFLPLFSVYLLPAFPDILINTLSSSPQMKSMYFQYTAIITPWLFIATIGALNSIVLHISVAKAKVLLIMFTISTLAFSYLYSPLPYARNADTQIWWGHVSARKDILLWQQILKNETITVSATGQFAPYLTSRRYYYDFGAHYDKAEYVLVRPSEIAGYWIKGKLVPYYDTLIHDERYKQIYNNNDIEVYKRIGDSIDR